MPPRCFIPNFWCILTCLQKQDRNKAPAPKQWGLSSHFPANTAATNSELLPFNYLPPRTKIQRLSDSKGSTQGEKKKTFLNPSQKFWEFAMAFKTHSSPDFTRTDSFLDLFSLISLSLEVKSSSRVKIFYHCNLVTTIYTICPKFSHYSCHSQLFTGSGTCSFRGNLQITTN